MSGSHRSLCRVLAAIILTACSACADPAGVSSAFPASATEGSLVATGQGITTCGTTLTAPGVYYVAGDLLDCPGTAIEIAADGVTLLLQGHTLRGVGVGAGIGIGATTFHPVNGVRVEGPGTVDGFFHGVNAEHMVGSVVTGLTIQRNQHGLGLNRSQLGDGSVSSGDSILRNRLVQNVHHGISVNGGVSSVILGNRATGNGQGPFNGFGIYLYDATDIEVRHNEVVDNYKGGVVVEQGQSGNRILGNVARRNHGGDLADLNCGGNIWQANRYDRILIPTWCPGAGLE